MQEDQTSIIPVERIERTIYLIRGQKVMLDFDLAELYGTENRLLKRAVRRNIERFPSDFMLLLSSKEFSNLKSQIGISSSWGGRRRSTPYAFTEQGVAMLSSIIRSKRAIQVNVQIMRTFVRLREMMLTHKELAQRLEELEKKHQEHAQQFAVVFDAIRKLMEPPPEEKKGRIGFHQIDS